MLFLKLPVGFQPAQRLDSKALTARALIDVAQLAGAALTDNLTGEDSHKHPDIEIYTEAEERHDIPPVPGEQKC